MAKMPAALEWNKVLKLDPENLINYEKEQLDEICNMLTLVTVHTFTP